MSCRMPLHLLGFVLLLLAVNSDVGFGYSRDDFPDSFEFGAGTSAYQVEGAAAEDGRTPSVWDTFTHAGKMKDKSTGDVAADGYHKYKTMQKGRIGLNVYTICCYPFTNSSEDAKAAQRVLDFNTGWILNPLTFGDYPLIMKQNAGSRIPSFTKSEAEQIKGSFDFIGINYYVSVYVGDNSGAPTSSPRDFYLDTFATITADKNVTPSSPGAFIPTYIPVDPVGLQKMLEYIKQVYQNPPVYVHENGYGLGLNDTLNDTMRIDFLTGFIGSTLDAIRNGSNVRGYFVWSFLDMFEFLAGYTFRFGLYFVDFEDKERRRIPKLSAHWYSNFLQRENKTNIQYTSLSETSHVPL